MNILEVRDQQSFKFDYSNIDKDVSEFLQVKATEIKNNMNTIGNNYTQLGQDFKIAQDTLAQYGYGYFGEWFTSLGFKKATVYRLIDRYNLIVSEGDKQELIEKMPLTLVREIVKKNVDEELKEEVLAGKITTTKEFKERVKQKKEATQVKQLAGQIDITEVVEVEDKQIESTQDTQITDIDTIYNIALNKLEEINIRQGGFYNDGYGFLEISDISSLIITMHQNEELTLEQMTQIAQKYKLDIPIVFSSEQEVLDRYYKQLDKISNSYRQYTDDKSYVYDVVESQNYDYEFIVECNFEEDEATRKEYQDNVKELLVEECGLTLTVGYDAFGTENLVIYNNKKLIANYNFHTPEGDKYNQNDWNELENYITKLFELDNIDSKYINLLKKLKYKLDRTNKAHLQIVLDNNKKSAKFTYVEGEFTFLILNKNYINRGDTILIYQNLKEFGSCHLTDGIEFGQYNFDIEINSNADLRELLGSLNNTLCSNFRIKAKEENRKIYKAKEEQERKQREQYKSYSNSYSSYSGLGSFAVANKDKDKCKRAYKALSKAFHPDLSGGSTEMMQFVNDLKQEWGV